MSLLTKPEELKGNTVLKGLIYGQPGIGKTTLALSANNPVCIDFDKGMGRVEPQFRAPSLQVENFAQVLELINSEEIKAFDTIVIDTLGKMIDRIGDYVASQNPKLRQSDGQMSMKGWGAIKLQFNSFLKLLESKNKSVIFVAHESEEKEDDQTKKRPDVSGSARKDIVKELDFMGYMEVIGNKRVITFSPTEKFYAKNSVGLEGAIEVPHTKAGNTFVAEKIFKASQVRLTEQADLREKYNALKETIDGAISDIKTPEDANNYYAEMGKLEVIWNSKYYEQEKFKERVKALGFEFDKESKKFVSKEENAS